MKQELSELIKPSPHVDDYEWERWRPGVRATLVLVRRANQVLLIHKKTGLGEGKVNGPGGKLEVGERWEECARREVMEELSLSLGALWWAGELRFLMSDYPDIHCHVFITDEYKGVPTESTEAKPFWCSVSEIPWELMWEDDRYWLPRALLGERVLGSFSFIGDALQSMCVARHPSRALDALPQPYVEEG